mmetsp:Transcript_15076/g.30615  ORF Transcript_15076/g.30615 Transcript_15076/m.30615 type:complete len:80 (+) Transcript_15076:407-646(+)
MIVPKFNFILFFIVYCWRQESRYMPLHSRTNLASDYCHIDYGEAGLKRPVLTLTVIAFVRIHPSSLGSITSRFMGRQIP